MSRSSPGVLRVAAILNFLADHPGQPFNLTDLVKALKLSRATCHALLTSLVQVGYLYRGSDKNYVLGPTLASIGKIALQHNSPLQVAQPEMRALADEFDAICSAFFRDRDEIVVRDRAASVSHIGWSTPIGTRLKLRPAFAAIFYAWSPMGETNAWLDSYVPQLGPEHRTSMIKATQFIREHGYAFHELNPNLNGGDGVRGETFGDNSLEFPTTSVVELDPDREYRAASILAPVFDASGNIAFILGLLGFTHTMRGAEVAKAGERLRESCARITSFITGRRPEAA